MAAADKEVAMCTNGVNTGQLELMIEQIDDHLKLERRWTHNLAHNAEDAGFATVSEAACGAGAARRRARDARRGQGRD